MAEQLHSARKEFSNPPALRAPRLFPVPAKDDASDTNRIRDLLKEIGHLSEVRNSRVNTLRNQVEALRTLLKQNQADDVAATPPPLAELQNDISMGKEQSGESQTTIVDAVTPEPDSASLENPEKPATTNPAATKKPVDRLALADNLFGSREFPLAREIYEALLTKSPNSEDAVWLRYQIACCHRKLDNRSKAQQYYRVVAGQKHSQILADNARWWLDRIEQRQQLEQLVARLKQSRKSMQEQFHEASGK